MNIVVRAGDEFSKRVQKLVDNGVSEKEAVEAVKMAMVDIKKNPRKYLQPFKMLPNGKVIRNDEFYDVYGDPDKNFEGVGKEDWKHKLESDKLLEDVGRFTSGKYRSYSINKV